MHRLILVLSVAFFACSPRAETTTPSTDQGAAEVQAADAKLAAVIAGAHRAPENRARDGYRHPAETLQFFGLRDNMTVVEISPGEGWYTEILAPYLRDNGTYYAAGADPESPVPYLRNLAARFQQKLQSQPALYDKVRLTFFAPPTKTDIAPAGSADMVLTFRNVHNWMATGKAQDAFNAFNRALKPGGILGVVEHRAAPHAPADPTAPTGYVHEETVVRFAQNAGFELVARSEINANPRDTKDHPRGVWTLPPTYRLKDTDREKYAAIGESDRMTLRFRKVGEPATTP